MQLFPLICFAITPVTLGMLRNIRRCRNSIQTLSTLSVYPNDVSYTGLHHCGILISNLEAFKKFFIDVLGMEDVSYLRPKTLPFPGAFIRVGVNQLHLMQLPNPDKDRVSAGYAGRDRHIAIEINSVLAMAKRLDEQNVPYKTSSSGRPALFLYDPDGNGFEFTESLPIS
jgi:glyoxylase I family protein